VVELEAGDQSPGSDSEIPQFAVPRVGVAAADQIAATLTAVGRRLTPSQAQMQKWFLIGNAAGSALFLVAAVMGYVDIHATQPQNWGDPALMLLPPAVLAGGFAVGKVGVPLSPFSRRRLRLDAWNIAARTSRMGHLPKMTDFDDPLDLPPFGCLFAIGTICMLTLLGTVAYHGIRSTHVHPSWRSVSADVPLGLTLFLTGMLVEAFGHLVTVRLYRRWLIGLACWGDVITWNLLDAAVAIDAVELGPPLRTRALRPARAALLTAARQIEADPIALAAVGARDLLGRRRARADRLRIAALLRSHADALVHVRDTRDWHRLRAAVVKDLRTACAGEWEAILERAPEAPGYRRGRLARGVWASVLLVAALLAPVVPGLGAAADYRLPLLLTALLTLLSGTGSAREVVKDAAGKGLWDSAVKGR
jgi:hypothetical protein